MGNASFSILDAVRQGYALAWRGRGYLLRLAGPVVALTLATGFAVHTYRPEASTAESFLWSLPSNALLAWFLAAQVRFLLLGERVDALPADAAALARRGAALRLSVLCSLAFNTFVMGGAMIAWSFMGPQNNPVPSTPMLLGIFVIAAVLFWALRFSAAYIPAAVDYPLRAFLDRVRGLGFCVRLMVLIMTASAPFYVLMGAVSEPLSPPGEMPEGPRLFLALAATSLLSIAAASVTSAAATSALKEILGRRYR